MRPLSYREVQKHSSKAAMDGSCWEEPRHFISFLCHVDFHPEGHHLIWNPNLCINIPEFETKKGEEKRHISFPELHFLSLDPPFSLISHRPKHIHVALIPDGVCLAKMRGSATEEEKVGGSLMPLVVSTTLSEMSFIFHQKLN